jgi:hypothetical protein
MAAKRTKRTSATQETEERHRRTPTFLLELPLGVSCLNAELHNISILL